MGDHGEVNGAVFFDETCGRSGEGGIEVVAVNGGLIGLAVAIGVFEEFDHFRVVVELLPLEEIGFLARPFLVVGGAVFERHVGNVAIHAVAEVAVVLAAVANVLDLDAPAVGLSDVNAIFSIDANRGDIIDLILAGELGDVCSFGNVDLGKLSGRLKLGLKRKDECESGGAAESREIHECRAVIRVL